MSITLFNRSPPGGAMPPAGSQPPGGGNTSPAGSQPPGGGTTPPAGSNPPDGPVTVYRYRCVEACTFQKRYRNVGDMVELSEKRDTLPHFVPVI
jgi:hypothetical protein